MERKKKVRLSDIAERLNVSTVTISKALANKEGVGDDLRKQIKQVAEEMGYKVKKSTPGVNGAITGNIGILIPNRFFRACSHKKRPRGILIPKGPSCRLNFIYSFIII